MGLGPGQLPGPVQRNRDRGTKSLRGRSEWQTLIILASPWLACQLQGCPERPSSWSAVLKVAVTPGGQCRPKPPGYMPAEPPPSGLLSSPLLSPCPGSCLLGSELGLITSWVPGGGLLLQEQEQVSSGETPGTTGAELQVDGAFRSRPQRRCPGLLFTCLVVAISYHTALLFIPQ